MAEDYLASLLKVADTEVVSNPLDGVVNLAPSSNSESDITSVLSSNKQKQQAALLSAAKATPPSQNMEDANAFIRSGKGAAQVNANSGTYGVTASVGDDGKIALTNVGVPQYPVADGGQGPGTGSIAPNTPLAVGSLFNKLRVTTDVDTARGIAASLREAAAVEQTKFETQALTFANNKLGVPGLEKQLAEAQAADLADPKYRPGMGDSPITARIRTTLEDARNKANPEAQRFLAQNAQYATLGATLKSADSEIARITKLGDRKDQLMDTMAMQADMRRQQKEDILTDAARGLDGVQRQRLLMLNPELSAVPADKLDADMMRTITAKKNDKQWQVAFQAPEEALPSLALTGNTYAESLVLSKEQANTGTDPAITKARLDNLRVLTNNKDFLKKAFEEQYAGDPKAKAKVADAIASFNEKGLTPEGKATNNAIKMQLALDLAKKQTTVNFANNAGAWKVADPEFQAAVGNARQVTGGTKMDDVLTSYLKDATGPDLVKKTQIFADYMTQEAQKQEKSVFGQPNYIALRSQIFNRAAKGPIRQWLESAGRTLTGLVPQASADAMQYSSPVGTDNFGGGGITIPDPLLQQDINNVRNGGVPQR